MFGPRLETPRCTGVTNSFGSVPLGERLGIARTGFTPHKNEELGTNGAEFF
jgi:hypothetical protein